MGDFSRSDFLNKILCENAVDVIQRMPQQIVDTIITQPFGSEKLFNFELLDKTKEVWKSIKQNDILKDSGFLIVIVPNAIVYSNSSLQIQVTKYLNSLGFKLIANYVWNKKFKPESDDIEKTEDLEDIELEDIEIIDYGDDIKCGIEFILVFVRKSRQKKWKVFAKDIDLDERERFAQYADDRNYVWEIAFKTRKNKSEMARTLPDKLVYRLIKLYSNKGDLVMDPFGGYGTVVSVAERYGRNYLYIDDSDARMNVAKFYISMEFKKQLGENKPAGSKVFSNRK